MKGLRYGNFSAVVEYDDEDEIFVGRIVGINDVVGFHADNVAELKAAFAEAAEDYVKTCKRIGKRPERSYSGKVMLRVPPRLHSRMAKAAEMSGKSLNQWGEEVIEKALS